MFLHRAIIVFIVSLAGCFLYTSVDAFIIGCVGALLTSVSTPLFDRLGVDDPVGASAVHGMFLIN